MIVIIDFLVDVWCDARSLGHKKSIEQGSSDIESMSNEMMCGMLHITNMQ